MNGDGNSNNTAIVVAVAAMFMFVVAAVVVITIAIPEGGNAGSLVALMFTALAATIPAVIGLARIGQVDATTRNTQKKVNDLTNGVMDEKIQRNVKIVLAEQEKTNER